MVMRLLPFDLMLHGIRFFINFLFVCFLLQTFMNIPLKPQTTFHTSRIHCGKLQPLQNY